MPGSFLVLAAAFAISSLPAIAPAQPMATYKSKNYPYSITYPKNWVVSTTTYNKLKVDVFISPTANQKVRDNVNIFASAIPTALNKPDTLRQANESQIVASNHVKITHVGTVRVAGQTLTLISWPETRKGQPDLVTTQAYLPHASSAYYFTLTTVQGDTKAMLPVFVRMLQTFRLISTRK